MIVAIIDYGSGNLRSAAKAFERAAAEANLDRTILITADAADLAGADHIVLPGVGAYGDCKAGLTALPGMIEALEKEVVRVGKPFLGICVGMQLMATEGLEYGVHHGFDWIPGRVEALTPTDPNVKVPHMGWNEPRLDRDDHPVFNGLNTGGHMYFAHAFHLRAKDASHVLATVDHGGSVAAAVGRDNMIGTQFHPEKSQTAGLVLIANFLNWRP